MKYFFYTFFLFHINRTPISLSKNVTTSLSQETRPLKSNKRRKVEITSPREIEESVEEDMAPPTPPALDASNVGT